MVVRYYRLLPSLQQVLFVSQREPRIECYTRVDQEWRLGEASGLDATLTLSALEIVLPLSEIFAKVEFDSRTPRLHP